MIAYQNINWYSRTYPSKRKHLLEVYWVRLLIGLVVAISLVWLAYNYKLDALLERVIAG